MMDRRQFIAAGVLAGLGWRSLLRADSSRRLEHIGLQLYTVRHVLAREFEATLQQVAEIGYHEVELAGLYGRTPQQFRDALDAAGLRATATHVSLPQVRDTLSKTLDGAAILGADYVVCPSVDQHERTLDHWRRHAELFNRVGESCRAAGIQFAYHNHEFEFLPTEGMLPYDLLLAEADAALVKMEMDLFWITKGGQEPIPYFQRHPGRFPLVHVKDMNEAGDMVDLGKGSIDFGRIFAHSEQAGIRHYFVEHDEPRSPLESIRTGFAYLRQLRF